MKRTRHEIKNMSYRSPSHADALATLYEMIMEEVEERAKMPTVRRSQVRFALRVGLQDLKEEFPDYVRPSYQGVNQMRTIMESTLAALGCTIVDDDPEVIESSEYDAEYEISKGTASSSDEVLPHAPQTGDKSQRLRTLHEAKELIEKLIQETAQ